MRAGVLSLFLYSRASGLVVNVCVSLLRGLPFESAYALRPPLCGGSLSEQSFSIKLLWVAHAWISEPSTEKCSFDIRPCLSASVITSVKNDSTTL